MGGGWVGGGEKGGFANEVLDCLLDEHVWVERWVDE